MKTKAVRLYGKGDVRLESFTLPELKDNEILASVITDSICMSSWKLVNQGEDHKKTPDDIRHNPIMIGHEFCGKILAVGEKWKHQYCVGERYVVQANLQLPDRPDCPGYSYPYVGGDATYIIIPDEVMEQGCLIKYHGDTYFEGALIEPLSCVIGAFEANYHLKEGTYEHHMGIKKGGNLLIMGGTGPMGLLAVDYALHGPVKAKHVVVTGRDEGRLSRIRQLYQEEEGTQLHCLNTKDSHDVVADLISLVDGLYDDIFIMAPIEEMITQAVSLLQRDGCLNFFAGPQDKLFMAPVNFYDVHYAFTHYVGTSGGTTADMHKAVKMIEENKVHVANVITHILGLQAVANTTLQLPAIGGGKKLVYTHKDIPLTKLDEVAPESALGVILKKTKGIWSKEAERYILKNCKDCE